MGDQRRDGFVLRRLLVSILGFLALWLGTALPAVGAADRPTHPELVHAYAYDGDSATAPYGTAIERGPPTIVSAGRHAVGSPSCGVSACPAGSTSPSADGFDHRYKVARVTFDAGMIRGSVEDPHWDSVDVDHGGVAANTAEAVADAALAAGRTSGAAAELRVGGQVFTDVSTGGAPRVLNGSVQEALDSVPLAQRAPWHGACAEMGCLSQALDAGVNPAGGSIRAVAIGTSNPGHGLPKAICSSCSAVLDDFGVGR